MITTTLVEFLNKLYRIVVPIFIRDQFYLWRNPQVRYYSRVLRMAREGIRDAIEVAVNREDIQFPIFEIGAGSEYNKMVFLQKYCQQDYFKYFRSNIETTQVDGRLDLLCDGRWLPLKSCSVGTIICSEVLEHIPETSLVVEEIYRVLKNGGITVVTTPFYYPIHEHPKDYYRFTTDGLKHIFKRFSLVECANLLGDYNIAPYNILTILKK